MNKPTIERIEPKSALIQEVGWLAPNGKYYPCDYDLSDRLSMWHLRKAREIIDWLYPTAQVSENDYAVDGGPQTFLVEQGWIRLDVNDLWLHCRPTQAQVDAVFQLWSKPFQRFLPTEKMRLFLAWQKVNGMAQPGDEYFEFEASMPDADLPPLTVPEPFRLKVNL